jgi:hypothetical protein
VTVRTAKIVGIVALAVLMALAAGWVWGRSGHSTLSQQLRASDLRLRLTDAKSRILGGRVDLYSLNFGSAAQNFEAAQAVVGSILATYEPAGTSPRAGHLKTVQAELEDARRIAVQMRQDAHAQADRALRALSSAAQVTE